jgi:fatty-acyl-CoA synthase
MDKYVVHQLLSRTLITHPRQEIVSVGHRYTIEEFHRRVLRLANSLKGLGLKKGMVAGVLDVNTHRFLELHYALSMLGVVVHTINFRLAPEQLVYSMIHAEDDWVFVSEPFMKLAEQVTDKFKNWVVMSDDTKISVPEAMNAIYYEALIEAGKEEIPSEAAEIDETDVFSIFYTTGTTGKPKGIRYRHKELTIGTLQLFHHLALHEGGARVSSSDVFMPLIPFFHIHAWGMAFFPVYAGAKLVLPGAADPAAQADLIRKEKVTWLNMVPTQLHMLLDQPGFGQVKVLTGGSPLPSGLARRADAAGVAFSLIYGGSDQLGTAISVVPEDIPHDSPEALEWRRVGMRLLPMVDVSLRDKEGHEVPHDGKSLGQVWVRSPWLPDGYYKNPEATQQAYINGWFKTGDIGLFYPNGLLYVADREGDAVKSGGEWIPTGTLEAVLSEHPAVELVAVIPKHDERWGQRPMAIIKAREAVTGDALREFLKTKVEEGKIAKFWIPDQFEFVSEIPLTSAGKLNKAALREKYSR